MGKLEYFLSGLIIGAVICSLIYLTHLSVVHKEVPNGANKVSITLTDNSIIVEGTENFWVEGITYDENKVLEATIRMYLGEE